MAETRGMRWVVLYAAAITVLLALSAVIKSAPTNQDFDEIIVHRIKVVEPDGTLRMVISNHDRFPGVIEKGKELGPNPRPGAGMLFLNDEGTENGGLIFGGRGDANGMLAAAGVSLSFDKYGVPGNMVQLAGISDDNDRFAGLRIKDSKIGGNSN